MRTLALRFRFHSLPAWHLLLFALLIFAFPAVAKSPRTDSNTPTTTSSQLRTADSEPKTTSSLAPIRDPKALQVLRTVQQRVEDIRGISLHKPLPAYYLDSDTLQRLVQKEMDKQFPPKRRAAIEQMLKSLATVPKDFDLQQTIVSLLDEQVGGALRPRLQAPLRARGL